MDKTWTRYHKGVFHCQKLLEDKEHDLLYRLAQNWVDWLTTVDDNECFKCHPPYCIMDVEIKHQLINKLEQTNIKDELGHWTSVRGAFILKFDSSHAHSMDIHVDEALESEQVLSVVFTICSSDCPGGTIIFSNSNDGSNVSYTTDYTARKCSAYAFYGSFVAHGVKKLKTGVRYSYVLFFNTAKTKREVHSIWSQSNKFEEYKIRCECCFKWYANKVALRKHELRYHKHNTLPTTHSKG